ncbi:MAG: hypothetical protein ACI35V_04205 [Sphingobacterium composti]|uniref:hypothetical protein n=1 Tax=Sphingobacterium composti TaxID=363260 RepID=UPI00135CF051|nr:hypothetical protein [Sphingobacterium composti Ten et al. 2007 non Yoo et al. 2007]
MVENFTQTEDLVTYTNEVDTKIEDIFEVKLKEEIQNLVLEPKQSVIDSILQYSKTFSKI